MPTARDEAAGSATLKHNRHSHIDEEGQTSDYLINVAAPPHIKI